jgi:hypothetical protein
LKRSRFARLPVLACFLLAGFISACGGGTSGNYQPPLPTATPFPTGSPQSGVKLSVSSLALTNDTPVVVEISQPGYDGSFEETNDCTGIARITLRVNRDGKARLVVTPLAKGTCVVTITGGGGQSASLTVQVTPNPITLRPPTLGFTSTGSGAAKSVAVTQPGFSGAFGESSNCGGIATLVPSSNASGRAAYIVTPLGKGSCTALFKGGLEESASLFIDVELPGKVVVTPSSLAFAATGSSAAQNVGVAQSGYSGAFAESDDCAGIATLKASSNVGGDAAYVVTPVAKGDCSAKFTGGNGESAALTISVAPAGGVEVNPWSLNFGETGEHAAQSVAVSQAGYDGKFAESDDCSGIARVRAIDNAGGKASYSITPIARGKCTGTIRGGHGQSSPLAIAIAPPGKVIVDPSTLAFAATGSAAAQNVRVVQPNYPGSFGESDNCAGIATVVAKGDSIGRAAYTVTPLAAGRCTARFTGGNRESALLAISVTLPGKVVVAPASLAFATTGSSAAKSAAVSQPKYGGAFTESDDCGRIATVTPKSNAGGRASYAVTPLAQGSCTATFTGGNRQSAPLAISIALPGSVVVAPSSLTFVKTGPSAAQNVAVSQSSYSGTFAERNTCAGIATVAAKSNASGRATYAVTPLAKGNCSATFTGGNGSNAPLTIEVAPAGSVVVMPSALKFVTTGSSAAQNVAVSQSNYSGVFVETDNCSGVATLVAKSNAGGKAAFAVTPFAQGNCTARFHGGQGESAPLSIAVTLPGSVVVAPSSLAFVKTGSGAAQNVGVSQSNYGGAFAEANNCAGVATVVTKSNAGGSATYVVTPVAKGKCAITFTGGNHQGTPLPVSVAPPGPSPVLVNPSAMTFVATGSGAARNVAVTQANFAGAFTEKDTCSAVATIAQIANAGGSASYKVTPVAKGHCSVTFTGGENQSAPLTIAVAPPGSVVVNPAALTFEQTGSGAAQHVAVSQEHFTGAFAESDTCAGTATVVVKTNAGGSATYVVTPEARGTCAATFHGGNGQSGPLAIAVNAVGTVVVNPSSLTFTAVGSGAARTVEVSQAGYSGGFVAFNTCLGSATIVETGSSHGVASYRVTPIVKSTCSATFTGANHLIGHLAIAVDTATPGTVSVVPSSLTFHRTGPGNAVSVAVTQPAFGGSFTVDQACTFIASIVPLRNHDGSASVEVTPLIDGTCTATFGGGGHQSAPLSISIVTHGSVVVSPTSLTFVTTGLLAIKKVEVSQTGYDGTFAEKNTCGTFATVKSLRNAGGKAIYLVKANARGQCTVTFTGGSDESTGLPVTITPPGPTVVNPASLKFTSSGSGAAEPVAVSQSGYSGAFLEIDNCRKVATIAATRNAGGSAAYTVTPIGNGSCSAKFVGGNLELGHLSINVRLPGPVRVDPASLLFHTTGSVQFVVVSQQGYTGGFTESDDCFGVAKIVAASTGDAKRFSVTSLGAGSCTATFAGGNGESAPLAISVDLPGGVIASPAPLNFGAIGQSNAVVELVTQSNYSGKINQSNSCAGVASVTSGISNGNGRAHFNITPLAAGVCNIVFTGGNNESFTLDISITITNVGVNVKRRP